MPGVEGKQTVTPTPQRTAARLAVWSVSGALSGAVAACLLTMTRWLFLGGLPTAIRLDSSGQFYQPAEFTVLENIFFLARLLLDDALIGSIWGLIGGLVTALVSRYYRLAGELIMAAVLWAGLLAGFALTLDVLLATEPRGSSSTPWLMMVVGFILFAATGAAYGATLALFARLLSKLTGSGQEGSCAGGPPWGT
jgi:hypothetical protein